MLRCKLRIAIDHRPGFPSAQILQFIRTCAQLAMPGGPGMAKVMETNVFQSCCLGCGLPAMIGQPMSDWLPAISEAVTRMLSELFFQYSHRVTVKRHTSRCSVLGLVQPGVASIQIHPIPFQAGDLAGTTARCQGKANQHRKVWSAGLNQPVRFVPGQPSIPLDLAPEQPNFWEVINPLPFVSRLCAPWHPKTRENDSPWQVYILDSSHPE